MSIQQFARRFSTPSIAIVAVVLVGLAPTTVGATTAAPAGQISGGGGGVSYFAPAGETNDVTVSYDSGADTYTVTDTGVTAITSGNGACTVNGDQATCSGAGVISVQLELGDMNDTATIDASVPVAVLAQLGDGDDTLTDNSPYVGDYCCHGPSSLLGQGGNDTITWNAPGPSTTLGSIQGGDGNDTLSATGSAPAGISGGAGDDVIHGGSGHDFLDGGASDEPNDPNSGNDTISGGDGPDIIEAASGIDVIDGGPGEDNINAGAGDDQVSGGPDHDLLVGGAGDDVLNGGDGDDYIDLYGQDGADTIDGGTGDDVINGTGESVNAVDNITCGAGTDDVTLGEGDVVSIDCEQITEPFVCPAGPDPCDGTVSVTGTPPASAAALGRSALASTSAVVTIASAPFVAPPGHKKRVRLKLDKMKARQVLGGRQTAPALDKTRWKQGGRAGVHKRHFKLHAA